jgi:imidazolonepropionase-like amidohydrolase
VGTDTLMPYLAPGSSLHAELAEFVAAGIAPEVLFEIATRRAGEWLRLPGLGTLAPGAPADLLFLRADPRGDLSALTRIEAVVADGRLYRRAALEDALDRYDAHFHGRLYDTAMGIAVSLLRRSFAPERVEP